jgi:plasmid stabilization system protein ParE
LESCKKIVGNPQVGRKFLKSNGEYELYAKVNKHLVFYNFVGSDIEIHRILHESMDLEKRLKE